MERSSSVRRAGKIDIDPLVPVRILHLENRLACPPRASSSVFSRIIGAAGVIGVARSLSHPAISDRISLIGRLTRPELRSRRIPAAHVVERTLRLVQRKHSGRARDQRNDYDQRDEK
jgi:hypothetical protein